MDIKAVVVNKIETVVSKIKNVFSAVNRTAELKVDAFIFSRLKKTQIRALISGTGLHVVISLEEVLERNYLERFSVQDQDLINYVVNDSQSLASYLVQGQNVSIASKTYDKANKKVMFKVAAFNNDKNIEFEIDPAELSRNKFLLQLFNKRDAYSIGFAAAESRIRSEQQEMLMARKEMVKAVAE